MKRLIPVILLIVLVSGIAGARVPSGTITIPSLPTDLDGFLKLRGDLAGKPEGGLAVFVVAALIHVRNRELGKKCLTIALDRSCLRRSAKSWYRGFIPSPDFRYKLRQLAKMPFLPGIYVQGTTPRKGYALPGGQFSIRWKCWKYSRRDRSKKMFVYTTSGNMPRPVMMVRNNRGIWKVREYSSFFVGPIRMPAAPDTDDDL